MNFGSLNEFLEYLNEYLLSKKMNEQRWADFGPRPHRTGRAQRLNQPRPTRALGVAWACAGAVTTLRARAAT
jgi:hypothetical protein